jgi:hypothetical protein
MDCIYCKAVLQTAYSLKQHQKTAKYCLSKQYKDIPDGHSCGACGRGFTRKSSLDDHLKICKANIPSVNQLQQILDEKDRDIFSIKKDLEYAFQTIEDQKIQIESLQNRLQSLAEKAIERPTNHINNIGNTKTTTKTQNLIVSDWRPEVIKDKVEENFNLEHIEDGFKGVARFATKYITQEEDGVKRYQCTDSNREVFMYKDEDGVVQKDIKARKLKNAIKEPILKKTAELTTDECHRLMDLISSSKGKNDDVFEVSNIKMAILTKKTQEIRDIDDGAFSKEMAVLNI